MSVAASASTSHRSVFFNSGNVGMSQVAPDFVLRTPSVASGSTSLPTPLASIEFMIIVLLAR